LSTHSLAHLLSSSSSLYLHIYICLFWEIDPFEMKRKRGCFYLMHFFVGSPFFIATGAEILQLCFLVLGLLRWFFFIFRPTYLCSGRCPFCLKSFLNLIQTSQSERLRYVLIRSSVCIELFLQRIFKISSDALTFYLVQNFCSCHTFCLLGPSACFWTFCIVKFSAWFCNLLFLLYAPPKYDISLNR